MKIRATRLLILLLLISTEGLCQDFPTLAEIHDYNPGDEFHAVHYYCCNDLSFQLAQWVVKERIHDQEGLRYVVSRSLFDYLTTSPPQLVDTTLFDQLDTLVVTCPDSVIFSGADSSFTLEEMYNGRKIHTHSYWVVNTLKVEWYVEGCGRVYDAWRVPPSSGCEVVDSLIYFKKGTESWGETLLNGTTDRHAGRFLVYPNPAGEFIVIQPVDAELRILSVEILDATGKCLVRADRPAADGQVRISLGQGQLGPGVYFAYIRSRESILVNKFIKR